MRAVFKFGVLAAAIGLCAVAPASAQPASSPSGGPQPAPASEPNQVQTVTITAQRLEAINTFVNQTSRPNRFQRQIARWDRKICSTVLGLPEKHAQYMNDRLAVNAINVGLTPGQPGCYSNILIMVAPDADNFVAEVVKKHGSAFGKYFDVGGVTTNGRKALKAWVATPMPVRWWHISETASTDGIGTTSGGNFAVHRASRIRPDTRQVFARVIIIVDAERAKGVSYQALCDYISMVALAQIAPTEGPKAVPSILNLWVDRDAGKPLPTGMTQWDQDYLHALYNSAPDARDAKHQREEMTQDMKKAAAKEPKAPK